MATSHFCEMRTRSKSPKRVNPSNAGAHKRPVQVGQRAKPKVELDFGVKGQNTSNPTENAPQSPPFAAPIDFSSSPPTTPFSSPLDSGFGHDKYLIFFYRPHFISAFVAGAGSPPHSPPQLRLDLLIHQSLRSNINCALRRD